MSKLFKGVTSHALHVAILVMTPLSGEAQSPDPMEAMKRLCVMDYFRLCEGADPYGDEVRRCFDRNHQRLSEGCRAAIDAYHRSGGD